MSKFVWFIILMKCSVCFGQNDSTYYYFDRITPENAILNRISNSKDNNEKAYYKLVYFSKIRQTDSIKKMINSIESKYQIPKSIGARYTYLKAYYYRISQNDSLSFQYHSISLNQGYALNDSLTILASLSGLAQSYDYNDDNPYRLDYLNELKEKANFFNNDNYKIISTFLYGNYYLFRDKNKLALNYYKKTLENKFSQRDSSILLTTIGNIGALYTENIKLYDSAEVYYKKRLSIIDNNKKFQNTSNYYRSYINFSALYGYMNQLEKAKYFSIKADSIPIVENVLSRKSLIKKNLADIYSKLGDYKMAYENHLEYFQLTDSINRRELIEGSAKYENQELKIQNLKSESKRIESEADAKLKQNIAIGLAGSLALVSIIAFLIFKNIKRKQKLAEQEKEIETQKLTTVLKEQELNAIDAMIEGQEKERQRIANDLHDDLGGLMTTVKWHFNALKENDSTELYDKTNMLLDEAYQKIRSVSHAKNSGVIAKQGLLKAVKEMANKISVANTLEIEVIDHGLENRLENSLELTIFRIIQELTANTIKHAQATETTIHITNHDDSLNIMVEDNGIGFNPNQITKTSKGMGISSIDKRVEHLNGKMTIESEVDKGTTIIIDIPL